MRALLTGLLVAPVTALANPMHDARPDFMAQCVSDGNEAATCTCLFDTWSDRVSEDQQKLAAMAIMMFVGVPPSSQQDMIAAAAMVQSIAPISLQCALQDNGPTAPSQRDTLNMVDGLGRGGLGALIGAAIARPGPTPTGAVQDGPDAETASAMASLYETELTRVHGRPIESRAVADFQPVFTSYCRLRGGTDAGCGCAWGVLISSGASSDTAYLASRSEGDDVLEYLTRDRLNAALDGLDRYHRARAVCPD